MTTRVSRALLVTLLVTSLAASTAARQAAPVRTFNPQDTIPFDAKVTTGTLPNGLTFYVRQNGRPAKRVLLRLAVKTGSLDEADDQQGLAHMLEHMAFNGSAHFKPGELISYFESTGARLGPHVNASTGFEETIYMLDLPTDKPEVVEKGFTALADFAGGLTLDPQEIDKERGVVIEEWRGGLGAGSRIRDKQIPILYYNSRYAQRLPIGKPEILRTFPPARLRAFYDTWYRPDRMAIVAVGDMDPQTLTDEVKAAFGPLKARSAASPERKADVPLHKDLLISVVTDPEVTQSSVTIVRKRPRPGEAHVADYRRDLVQRIFEEMLNERFDDLTRRPDAKFLDAGVYGGTLSPDVTMESIGASVQDGKIPEGLSAIAIEAKRVRELGFGAGEMDRARKWMAAFYERAYTERDKTESGSFAQEYLNHFLEGEPSPGIDYEYALVQQLLPGINAAEVSTAASTLLADDSRVVLAVSPQKAGIAVPTEEQMRVSLRSGESVAVTAWNDTTSTRELIEKKPEPAAVSSTRTVPDVDATVVRFANGVDVWLRPTDFKNDQVVFTMYAKGGLSLAPEPDFPEASLATAFVGLSGAAGLRAVDLQKQLAGRLANASPFMALSTHGISGSAAPAQLETALQLLYAKFTQPGDDPEAFDLLKRQLTAAVVNRLDDPSAVFGDKLSAVNTSEPLHGASVDGRSRQRSRSQQDGGVLPGPVLERRGLHVLHGRRVQGRRGDAAAGAVCRRPACARGSTEVGVPRHGHAFSCLEPASAGRKGSRAAERDRDQLLRGSAHGADGAGARERGDGRAGDRPARHPPRGARADLHGIRGSLRAAPAAGRGPRGSHIQRVTRQHRQDDGARPAGSPEDADQRAVRRPAQSREGNRAPELRDGAEAESLLARSVADRTSLRSGSGPAAASRGTNRRRHRPERAGRVPQVLPDRSPHDRHAGTGAAVDVRMSGVRCQMADGR